MISKGLQGKMLLSNDFVDFLKNKNGKFVCNANGIRIFPNVIRNAYYEANGGDCIVRDDFMNEGILSDTLDAIWNAYDYDNFSPVLIRDCERAIKASYMGMNYQEYLEYLEGK